jgi:hypothetical protein
MLEEWPECPTGNEHRVGAGRFIQRFLTNTYLFSQNFGAGQGQAVQRSDAGVWENTVRYPLINDGIPYGLTTPGVCHRIIGFIEIAGVGS